jgi:hypothetical protein
MMLAVESADLKTKVCNTNVVTERQDTPILRYMVGPTSCIAEHIHILAVGNVVVNTRQDKPR